MRSNSKSIATIRIVKGTYRCREAHGRARAANKASYDRKRAIHIVAPLAFACRARYHN